MAGLVCIGRHYATGKVTRVDCDGERIVRLTSVDDPTPDFIAPGFIDLQVNGYGGRDFTSASLTVEDVVAISVALDRHGVTGYLPTITTQSFETIAHALRVIDKACQTREEAAERILGVHLEGPYISPHDGPRGAHPRGHCRPPDAREFERWQQAAGGRIRLVTLSPEYDRSPAFIRKLVADGVLVSIGHTNADSEQIAAAVEAGARMSTHLGNGAHPLIRRHPNYIWDQLADDRLTASIIADGHHLPGSIIKCFVRMKTPSRIVLVSDITGMAGQAPGRYSATLGDVEVLESGKLVVAGQRDLLAGAALPIEHGIGTVMQSAGVNLAEAVAMVTTTPAELLGLSEYVLKAGALANLVVFRMEQNGAVRVVQTVQRGKVVFEDRVDQ